MPEQRADYRITERVFRVKDRPLYGIALMLSLGAILPAMSIHELVTTGTIDMEAVGKGWRKRPTWISYLITWSIFLPYLWYFRPYFRYFGESEMFRLNERGIVIRGTTLAPDEVLGFRYTFFRGYVLQSTRGDFSIHPRISEGAIEALAEAFPHVPPPK